MRTLRNIEAHKTPMSGHHNYWLVLLSVIVSTSASFVALEAVSRVTARRRRGTGWPWLAGAAVSLGTGIWTMHFIGMLGFELPVPVSYDVFLTLVSLAIAILAAALAFWWVSGRAERAPSVIVGGMLVGCGIAAMHYVGMAAMKIEPPIRYDPALFGLSIVVAVSASAAALCGAFELRGETLFSALWKKAGSAVIMGTAIYGMHYTGMAAAHFAPGAVSAVTAQHFDHVSLATALGAFTLLFLLGTLLMSAFDAYAGARALMHTRERLSDDLRRHMTELATAVAREINQPLAAMSANAGAAQRWISGEKPNTNEAKNALHRIGADATRAAQVIGRIRAFLGGSEGRRPPWRCMRW